MLHSTQQGNEAPDTIAVLSYTTQLACATLACCLCRLSWHSNLNLVLYCSVTEISTCRFGTRDTKEAPPQESRNREKTRSERHATSPRASPKRVNATTRRALHHAGLGTKTRMTTVWCPPFQTNSLLSTEQRGFTHAAHKCSWRLNFDFDKATTTSTPFHCKWAKNRNTAAETPPPRQPQRQTEHTPPDRYSAPLTLRSCSRLDA